MQRVDPATEPTVTLPLPASPLSGRRTGRRLPAWSFAQVIAPIAVPAVPHRQRPTPDGRVSTNAGYATTEASGRDRRSSYTAAGAPVRKKVLGTTNKRRVSFLRSGVSPGSFSRHHGQACWNGEGLLAQRRNAVNDPEQRKQRPRGSVVGDDQVIAFTPFIGIADVGSREATLTVGDLQTGDAVAGLDPRIADNEWLDKLEDRAERGVIGSTSAMRVDIETHPGDRPTPSR